MVQVDRRLSGEAALAEERAAIGADPDAGGPTALCLSGGGIRSAAFALGVVQALARAGLLRDFHYLSTVSGGGYTGAWLTALLQRHRLAEVEAMLAETARGKPAPALSRLRASGNFLTPDPGLFSLDTWTGITLYLRNLFLTWLGLLPLFLIGVLLLVSVRTLFAFAGGITLPLGIRLPWAALAAGFGLLACTTCWLCQMLPSHRPLNAGKGVAFASRAEVHRALWWLMPVPLLLTLGGNPDAVWGRTEHGASQVARVIFALYGGAVTLGYAMATLRPRANQDHRLFLTNLPSWLFGAAVGGGFLAGLFWSVATLFPDAESRNTLLVVLGPAGTLVAITLHVGAHAGMRAERGRATLDREWTARLSATMLRVAVLWVFFSFAALMLSNIVLHVLDREGASAPFWVTALVPLLSGPVAAWAGKQAWSQMDGAWSRATTGTGAARMRAIDLLLKALAVVFLAGLPAALTFFLEKWMLVPVQDAAMAWNLRGAVDLACVTTPPLMDCLRLPSVPLLFVAQAVVMLALVVLAWRLGGQPNRHSMHAIYRNRLARAFIGAALEPKEHDADPFSGFSPLEGERLAAVADRPDGLARLFPVLNCAVNMTGSERSEWAERMALSFAATPLHCGFHVPGDPSLEGGDASYAATASYAGPPPPAAARGISLAAAVTISGAAASPNWGYHSQPETAFLMTLFNTRLGIWLPNPASPRVGRRALAVNEPPGWWQGVRAQLGDLMGQASIDDRSIYLSDGGHFENLGVYEMLRRRCRLLVVSDATMDGDERYTDLGNLVRKARIDLGASIDIRPAMALRGRPGVALGSVTYADGSQGSLLYVKPCCAGDPPADVRAYHAANPEFPHESTTDQWFSESQFESYRRLGQHQMEALLGEAPEGGGLAALFVWLATTSRVAPSVAA